MTVAIRWHGRFHREQIIPTTIAELPGLVAARRGAETPPSDVVVYTIPQVWGCNQVDPWRGLPARTAMWPVSCGNFDIMRWPVPPASLDDVPPCTRRRRVGIR